MPIFYRAAHVAKHPLQFIGEGLLLGGTDNAVALHQNHRLDGIISTSGGRYCGTAHRLHLALYVTRHTHQRMHHPVRRAVAAVDGHGDGVHQERHVVMDNLHHCVVADKAILGQCRVEDAHRRGTWRPGCIQQAPMGIGNSVKTGTAARRDFVWIGVVEVGGDETVLAVGCAIALLLGIGQQFGQGGRCHVNLRRSVYRRILGSEPLPVAD